MRRLREFVFRLGGLFNKQRKDREFDDEIEYHLQLHIEDNLRLGMTSEEARRRARIKLGGIESTKEAYRDQRGLPWLETLGRDVRYGARMLRKNPGFTAVAVLTLALGIGANTAIFSLADAFLLKLLSVRDPERLFFLSPDGGRGVAKTFNFISFEHLRDHAQSTADIFAYRSIRFRTGDGPSRELINGQLVSGNYFSGLGVGVGRGRFIGLSDDQPGVEGVAVISHQYAERRFGDVNAALGKHIALNGVSCTVIGVTPPGFLGVDITAVPDVFAAIQMQPKFEPANAELLTSFGLWPFTLMARMHLERDSKQATTELTVLFQQILADRGRESLRDADIKDIPNRRVILIPGRKGVSKFSEQMSKPLSILMSAAGSILLIACANVANLLLNRGAARRKEIAVRLATGATRARVIRQLVAENALLAMAGALLGLLLAQWSKHFLLRFLAPDLTAFVAEFELDYRMVGFTGGVSVLAVLLFGVAPAWRMTRVELAVAFKESVRNLSSTGSRLRQGNALVVAQVAVSLLVLVGAGLFVRTLWELREVNIGFNPDNVALITVKPAVSGYSEKELDALVGKLVDPDLIARLEKLHGVKSASLSSLKPIADLPWWWASLKPLDDSFTAAPADKVYLNAVTPGYFATLGLAIQNGRDFTATDRSSTPIVSIVNETLARRHFGDENPLGKRFAISGLPFKEILVVGLVKDSKVRDVRSAAPSLLYMPFAQFPTTEEMKFAVKVTGDPTSTIAQIRNELERIDKNLVVDRIETARLLVDATLRLERSLATLTSIFGVLGLILASMGLYGIMAYSVSLRTFELGIRMALGANHWKVLRMVLRQGLQLVAAGVLIGLAAALALTRVIASQLFGISPTDPLTLISVSLGLALVALAACWFPARRAARIDPMVALRYE